MTLDPDDLLVSFDLETLFTNVPTSNVLSINNRQILENNHKPSDPLEVVDS